MISNFRNSPFITKFFGFEPWHFIVVQDPALRELIKPVVGAPLKLDTASHFVLGLSMKAPLVKHDSAYISSMMKDVKNAC
jgi:nitroreductase